MLSPVLLMFICCTIHRKGVSSDDKDDVVEEIIAELESYIVINLIPCMRCAGLYWCVCTM